MKSLADELREYFENTLQEKLDADWEAIHGEYAYGFEAMRFINQSRA